MRHVTLPSPHTTELKTAPDGGQDLGSSAAPKPCRQVTSLKRENLHKKHSYQVSGDCISGYQPSFETFTRT